MQRFELTKEFIQEFIEMIVNEDHDELHDVLNLLYPADIAEIFDSLNLEQAVFITGLLETSKKVDVLAELEPDVQKRFFVGFTTEEIATEFIQHMDSDDAVDILSLLDDDEARAVISAIPDNEQSLNLTRMLRYPDNSAGGLMARELIKVNVNWTISECTEEIRKQAEEVTKVNTVYAVDDNDTLLGWVSLKQIILAKASMRVSEIHNTNVIFAEAHETGEQVAAVMAKYDLIALPIVDSLKRLIGRITIDDVVDFIQEEAEKDYQMLSGITQSVTSDRVWILSKARLPWLIIGLFGGVMGSLVIKSFENSLNAHLSLALFMPLIAAMGGNVGVQSSSIVVQGLANNSIEAGRIAARLGRELLVALLNGLICASLIIGYTLIVGLGWKLSAVVSISLFVVILFASIMGTLIPLVLERLKIDPALATGPFITTSNDLIGLFLYFTIGILLL